MRVVIQRVKEAYCKAENFYSRIGKGILIFLGITKDDTEKDIEFLVKKCANLRIFEDEQGKMNLSVKDVGGEVLIVSQFTLYGDCKKGLRPSFDKAAKREIAEPLYNKFIEAMRKELPVKTGVFGAKMEIGLVNDGPVTFIIDSK